MLNNKRLGPPAFAKGGSNHLSSFFSANYDEPDDGVDNSKQDFPASNVKPFITKSEASVMQCNVHPQTVYDLISFSEETNKETNSSLSTSHPPPKGAAVPQLKENPIKLASAASKPSLVQALAKPAPRVSPITILEDAPTKTPANTQDSDLQSGTQSPSHMDGANEEINEIFEGLSEHVHSALMDVHAMCCEGAQEVLEQTAILDQMSAAVHQNNSNLKKRKRRTVEAVDNIRRRLSESLEDGTDADTE